MRAPTIDHLFVLWSELIVGRRRVIGHLTRTKGLFRFWYEPDLQPAMAQGFDLLPMFPDHRLADDPYDARYLWATFADRIPSPRRPDAHDILERWGVPGSDDQFEILARSGGLRATDRIELAEYRAVGDPLTTPLDFRIAGARYLPGITRPSISPGDRLTLEREPSNQHDPAATLVLSHDGMPAGYVPRQYSAMIADLLDREVRLGVAAIRELLLPNDAERWVVRASRA